MGYLRIFQRSILASNLKISGGSGLALNGARCLQRFPRLRLRPVLRVPNCLRIHDDELRRQALDPGDRSRPAGAARLGPGGFLLSGPAETQRVPRPSTASVEPSTGSLDYWRSSTVSKPEGTCSLKVTPCRFRYTAWIRPAFPEGCPCIRQAARPVGRVGSQRVLVVLFRTASDPPNESASRPKQAY